MQATYTHTQDCDRSCLVQRDPQRTWDHVRTGQAVQSMQRWIVPPVGLGP